MTMNLKVLPGILLVVPLLCGLRDPFAPVDDPCHSAQLNLWRFGGTIEAGGRTMGIVQRLPWMGGRLASFSAMTRYGNVWKTIPY